MFCIFSEICSCNDAVFNAIFRLVLPAMVITVSKERMGGLRRINSDDMERSVRQQLNMSNVDEQKMSHNDFRKIFETRRGRR